MSNDTDSPIRVVVTPSQSSCFAGEMMSISITFTNTNTSQQTPSRVASHSHKRGAHSISAVPLAQPPTSPRSPRTVLPVIFTRELGESDVIERKGLIGRSNGSSKRMRTLNRSLSLDMTFKGNGEVSPQQESSPSPQKTPIHVQRALGTTACTSSHCCSREQRSDLLLKLPHLHASRHPSQDRHHFQSPPNTPTLANNQCQMVKCHPHKICLSPLPPPTSHTPSLLTLYPRVRLEQVHPLHGRLLRLRLPGRRPALVRRSVR